MAIWKSLTLNLHRFFAQKPISLKAMLNGKTSQLNDAEIKVTPKNTIEHTKDNRISFEPFEVFVGNLAWSDDENDVREVFKSIESINKIQFLKNRKGQSQGAAFVSFLRESDVLLALNLNFKIHKGRPLIVNSSDDNHKRSDWLNLKNEKSLRTIFIGNIPNSYTVSNDLYTLLSKFGKILKITYPKEKNGISCTYAFVEFSSQEEAERLISMDKVTLNKRVHKVCSTKRSNEVIKKNLREESQF